MPNKPIGAPSRVEDDTPSPNSDAEPRVIQVPTDSGHLVSVVAREWWTLNPEPAE